MTLRASLGALVDQTDAAARLATDPAHFVQPYRDRPRDAEIAGVFAAQLAYGRVDLFRPVLQRLFERMDDVGGPRAFVDAGPRVEALRDLNYRWNRPIDFAGMSHALRRVCAEHGSLAHAFAAPDARAALELGVGHLRGAAAATAPDWWGRRATFDELPRGLRNWLSLPSGGSACKRWNLYLRWMVRPATEGIDLGHWSAPTPAGLIMPLDTHVHRLAQFLGLSERKSADWRAAARITDALRALDPVDPVRFDFALAHLGISGDCAGGRDGRICPSCPLEALCVAPPVERRGRG